MILWHVAKFLISAIALVVGPMVRLLLRLFGKGWLKNLVVAMVHDEEWAQSVGESFGPQFIEMMRNQVKMLLRADLVNNPAMQHWGKWLEGYGLDPQPIEVPDFLRFVRNFKVLVEPTLELAFAGAIEGLCERHPELVPLWREEFVDVMAASAAAMVRSDDARPGWNDFHMARWHVLRSPQVVEQLVMRARRDDSAGLTARGMLASVASRFDDLAAQLADAGLGLFPQGPVAPGRVESIELPGMDPAGPTFAVMVPDNDCAYSVPRMVPYPAPLSAFLFQVSGPGLPDGALFLAMDTRYTQSMCAAFQMVYRAGQGDSCRVQ